MERLKSIPWRDLLSRLPLPMLALAASYGVYSFALLFVPWWVALAQASAYETTYISLAVVEVPEAERRRRARRISLAAVAVSVVYNSAAGYFHRNPEALLGLTFVEELALAVAHGAPLAIVAYLVADLLLHSPHQVARPLDAKMPSGVGIQEATDALLDRACPRCGAALDAARYGAAVRWGYCATCKEGAEEAAPSDGNGRGH